MFSFKNLFSFYKFTIAQDTAVLILARGGSKGIRLKNLSPVGGISLLARSITTARTAGYQDITVSTDHPLIALEALKCKYVLVTKNTKLLSVLPVCDASSSFSYILFMLMNLSFVMARFFLLKIVYLIFLNISI